MKRIAIVLQSKVCGGEANSLNQIIDVPLKSERVL